MSSIDRKIHQEINIEVFDLYKEVFNQCDEWMNSLYINHYFSFAILQVI